MLNIGRKLLQAIILKGNGKLLPIHTFGLIVAILFFAWLGSPYFMLYVVGPPEPGTAPRLLGTLRQEGVSVRTRSGWNPPRYFLVTGSGEIEVHCGYRPKRTECVEFPLEVRKSQLPIQVGYDKYWGIDYIKFPAVYPHLFYRGSSSTIAYRRFSALHNHQSSAIIFCLLFFCYSVLVIWTFRKLDSRSDEHNAERKQNEGVSKASERFFSSTGQRKLQKPIRSRGFWDK